MQAGTNHRSSEDPIHEKCNNQTQHMGTQCECSTAGLSFSFTASQPNENKKTISHRVIHFPPHSLQFSIEIPDIEEVSSKLVTWRNQALVPLHVLIFVVEPAEDGSEGSEKRLLLEHWRIRLTPLEPRYVVVSNSPLFTSRKSFWQLSQFHSPVKWVQSRPDCVLYA
jgi:hypothetical protein